MIKYISTADFSEGEVILLNSFGMMKVAQAAEYENEAKKFIQTLKPTPDKFYCLVIALGAGEYWGANRNGDYFPEEELLKSYHTFETAFVYRLHQNKDPNKAIGRVIKAFWNDRMKRVELIIELDRQKAADILQRLENGETVDVSMGCKVEYDICSICGNRARSRAEYCDHLKNHMGEILPDGRQVFAINPNPKFFDLSFVRRGADPTAKVLMKVAEELALPSQTKKATITKQVPAQQVVLLDIPQLAMQKLMKQPDFPPDIIDLLAQHFPSSVVTLGATGIALKPSEFYALLSRLPKAEWQPEDLEAILRHGTFLDWLVEQIKSYLPIRSFWLDTSLPPKEPMPTGDMLYRSFQKALMSRLIELDNVPNPFGILVKALQRLFNSVRREDWDNLPMRAALQGAYDIGSPLGSAIIIIVKRGFKA